MTEPKELLAKAYALHVDRGGTRVPVVEQHFDMHNPTSISVDDRRNEHEIYQALMQNDGKAVKQLFNALLTDMRSVSYEHASGIMDALDFLQHVLTTAMWKHHVPVDQRLERFAREFDRLDVPAERRRLYDCVRGGHLMEV